MSISPKKIEAFISYSHRDMKYKQNLLTHFEGIKKTYNINFWHDGCIKAGGEIKEEVLEKLNSSNLVLLLISPSYISSNFCYRIEMDEAFKRYEKSECLIVPILIKDSTLTKDMPFYGLKTLPTDRKPLTSFRPQDKGCVDISQGLIDLIDTFFNIGGVKTKTAKKVGKKSPSILPSPPPSLPTIKVCKKGKMCDYKVSQELMNTLYTYGGLLGELSDKLHTTVIMNTRKYAEKKKAYTKTLTLKTKRELFQAFLLDICTEVRTTLFKLGGVRIHFRGLNATSYNCIMALNDKDNTSLKIDWHNKLKPMTLNSMISYSAKLEMPLIKSLNKDYHEPGNHDDIWKDYITCAFIQLYHSVNPIMSFGISVHKNYISKYKNVLIALASLRIDRRIENALISYTNLCHEVDSTYDLKKIINSLCK